MIILTKVCDLLAVFCSSILPQTDEPNLRTHFLEDPTNPHGAVRLFGSEKTQNGRRSGDSTHSFDRPGAWNMFATFHDRPEARTPQLAVHQRWRDYAEQFEDEMRKEKIVIQAQERRVDELDRKLHVSRCPRVNEPDRKLRPTDLDVPAALEGDHARLRQWAPHHVSCWLLGVSSTLEEDLCAVAEKAQHCGVDGSTLLKLTATAWQELGVVENEVLVSKLMARVLDSLSPPLSLSPSLPLPLSPPPPLPPSLCHSL